MGLIRNAFIKHQAANYAVRKDDVKRLKEERKEYGRLSDEDAALLKKRLKQTSSYEKGEELRKERIARKQNKTNKPVTNVDNRKQEFNINSKNNKEIGNGNNVEIASKNVKGSKSSKPTSKAQAPKSKPKK